MDFSTVLGHVVGFLGTCVFWAFALFTDVIFAYYPIGIAVSFIVITPMLYGVYKLLRG